MSNNLVDELIIPLTGASIAISCFVLFIAFPG